MSISTCSLMRSLFLIFCLTERARQSSLDFMDVLHIMKFSGRLFSGMSLCLIFFHDQIQVVRFGQLVLRVILCSSHLILSSGAWFPFAPLLKTFTLILLVSRCLSGFFTVILRFLSFYIFSGRHLDTIQVSHFPLKCH